MEQAEANREYFYKKHGVRGASEEYYAMFKEPTTPTSTLEEAE